MEEELDFADELYELLAESEARPSSAGASLGDPLGQTSSSHHDADAGAGDASNARDAAAGCPPSADTPRCPSHHPKRQRLCSPDPLPASLAAPEPQKQEQPSVGPLSQLTEELLLRVLYFLSPEDLCSVSRTSRFLHTAVMDGSLWRRLYYFRWPKGPLNVEDEEDDEEENSASADWKARYMERDHLELLKSVQSAPALLRPLYAQMATAKRSEQLLLVPEQLFRPPKPAVPPPHCSAAGGSGRCRAALTRQEAAAAVAAAIEAFRRLRGLTDPALHAAHCCGGGECKGFCRLDCPGDVWICATSGYVHRCGENCGEREVDPASNYMVCPISGRCFDCMMSEDEEDSQAQARGGEEARGEEDWQGEEGISGRLGRAFWAGYNAASEQELFRKFGAPSSRFYYP